MFVMTKGTLQVVACRNGGQRVMDRTTGQGFYLSPAGEMKSISDGLDCCCGEEFTSYVREHLEPVPYSHDGPASKDIDNLWPNRYLKMKIDNDWKVARVKGWREYTSGPFCPETFWVLTFKVNKRDDGKLVHGDQVKIDGLSSAIEHNGKVGAVKKFDEASGRYQVCYRTYNHEKGEAENVQILCKPENLMLDRKWELEVTKCDVDESGVLSGNPFKGMQDEIPFVWLDPPTVPVATPCDHGGIAENFEFGSAYEKAIGSYVGPFTFGGQNPQNFNYELVEAFANENPTLASDEGFCNHLFVWCVKEYLKGHLRHSTTHNNARSLLFLAYNLRYRYIPESNGIRCTDNGACYDESASTRSLLGLYRNTKERLQKDVQNVHVLWV